MVYFIGPLIIACFLIAIATFISWQAGENFQLFRAFIEFDGNLKMALQNCGCIKKDLTYVNYLRDVVVPKRLAKEKKELLTMSREFVEHEIIEAIEGNRRTARINLGEDWGDKYICDLPFAEAMSIITEISSKYRCGEVRIEEYTKTVSITIKKSED